MEKVSPIMPVHSGSVFVESLTSYRAWIGSVSPATGKDVTGA